MNQCRRYRIAGRVQGVFFRASTVKQAQRLGLSGWVRNCADDGSVEALACGDTAALAEFENWLRVGPPGAAVAQLTIEPAASAAIAGFVIRREPK